MIRVYSKPGCSNCVKAKLVLEEWGVKFETMTLDPKDPTYAEARDTLKARSSGHSTFPFVFVDDTFIGGYRELLTAYDTGRLKELGVEINEDW